MNRSLLISLCLVIVLMSWGLSWELLRFQTGSIGQPEATIPVFYRFLLSGVIFAGFILIRDWRRGVASYRFPLSTWGLIALLGAGLFSTNYSLYYTGQQGLPPGLVSLFFAFLVVTNLFISWLVLGHRPRTSTVCAAAVGFFGLILVLSPQIWRDGGVSLDWITLRQAGLCLLGTLVVSCATMVQVKLTQRQVPVVTSTAFAMLFGASYVGTYSYLQGYSFDVSGVEASWVYALIFLVLFGSILAFTSYLKLVSLIGPNRGGYIMLVVPVVALLVSYVAGSGGPWGWLPTLGVILILGGNAIILWSGQRAAKA